MPEVSLLLTKKVPTILFLQESLLKKKVSRTWLPGYQTIETRDMGRGNRGLVLAVRRDSGLDLTQYAQNEWFLAERIEGKSVKHSTSVTILALFVYIPCVREPGRQGAKRALIEFLREKANRSTWSHVVIRGDFNMNEIEFATLISQSKSGLEVMPNPRMKKRWSWSAIDHIAVKGFRVTPSVWPLQNWVISDHFSVYAKLNFAETVKPVRVNKISCEAVKLNNSRFVNDEKWNVVMGKEDADLSTQAKSFIDSV